MSPSVSRWITIIARRRRSLSLSYISIHTYIYYFVEEFLSLDPLVSLYIYIYGMDTGTLLHRLRRLDRRRRTFEMAARGRERSQPSVGKKGGCVSFLGIKKQWGGVGRKRRWTYPQPDQTFFTRKWARVTWLRLYTGVEGAVSFLLLLLLYYNPVLSIAAEYTHTHTRPSQQNLILLSPYVCVYVAYFLFVQYISRLFCSVVYITIHFWKPSTIDSLSPPPSSPLHSWPTWSHILA